MLETLIATGVAFVAIMAAMAIGVLFGRPAVRGSCGRGNECICKSSANHCELEKRKHEAIGVFHE